jgi:hypothetical protein
MIPTEFSPFSCLHCFFLQKRRERGRIDVRGIKLVEPAILHGDGGDASAPNVSVANLMTVDLPQSSRCFFSRAIRSKLDTQN